MRILFLSLLLSTLALAEDYTFDKSKGKPIPNFIARVKLLKGQVFKISQGKTTPADVGTQFSKSDSITTEARSFVKLTVVDDTVLTLGPNSRLDFEDFEFQDKNDRKLQTLIRGQLSAHVKNKAKEGNLKFKTPNAILGVRGTHLFINHRTIGKAEVSEFALLKGSAEVLDGQGVKHNLERADRLVVLKDTKENKEHLERLKLDEAQLKELAPLNPNTEEGDFLPVLPFFDPSVMAKNAAMDAIFDIPDEAEPAPAVKKPEVKDEDAENGSFNNLKKLNKELSKGRK